jgi:hypothetical protein
MYPDGSKYKQQWQKEFRDCKALALERVPDIPTPAVMVHGQHVTLVILVAQTTLSSPRSL